MYLFLILYHGNESLLEQNQQMGYLIGPVNDEDHHLPYELLLLLEIVHHLFQFLHLLSL